MDFGQADPRSLNSFRFELPEDDSKNVLPGKRAAHPHVYVGAPVWSHPGWVGNLYPPKTKSAEYLTHYSRQFNSIELNSSFYRVPDQKTLAHWKDSTPKDFRFSPKVHQGVSHRVGSGELIGDFCRKIQGLDDRLGMSFLQLPPAFSRNQLPSLRGLLRQASKNFKLAVEFRHPSWFIGQHLSPDAFDLLSEFGHSTVITDTTSRRDVLHATLTSSRVMIRFLGNELHPSDFTRLDQWVERLTSWIEMGATEIYFFGHQAGYDGVPELIQYFVEKLNTQAQLGIRNLKLLPSEEDSQPRLF
jgi:uncharacterized protein YecE (DUF72 family)